MKKKQSNFPPKSRTDSENRKALEQSITGCLLWSLIEGRDILQRLDILTERRVRFNDGYCQQILDTLQRIKSAGTTPAADLVILAAQAGVRVSFLTEITDSMPTDRLFDDYLEQFSRYVDRDTVKADIAKYFINGIIKKLDSGELEHGDVDDIMLMIKDGLGI